MRIRQMGSFPLSRKLFAKSLRLTIVLAVTTFVTGFSQNIFTPSQSPQCISSPGQRVQMPTYAVWMAAQSSNALPSPLMQPTDSGSPPIAWKPYDASTIAVQSALGLGDAALCLLSYHAMRNPGGAGPLLLLVAVPAALALPGIEYYFGEEMGGDGSLFWTVTGCIAGALAVNIPGLGSWSRDVNPIAIVTAVAAVGGGILGYHYFATPVYTSNPANAITQNRKNGLAALRFDVPGDQGLRVTFLSITF